MSLSKTDLIYDVGMHNGDDTAYYLHRGYRVIGIEANPALVDDIRRRFRSEIDACKLIVLNVAINSYEGECDFWISKEDLGLSSCSESFAKRYGGDCSQIRVRCARFDSILAEYGMPSYLKIDIEGSDLLCLEGLKSFAEIPQYLSIESTAGTDTVDRLYDLGYREFKLISQFDLVPIEDPPAELALKLECIRDLLNSRRLPVRILRKLGGRLILERWRKSLVRTARYRDGWYFSVESTGPFGELSCGQWVSRERIREIYLQYKMRLEQGEDSIFWFKGHGDTFWADFHASY